MVILTKFNRVFWSSCHYHEVRDTTFFFLDFYLFFDWLAIIAHFKMRCPWQTRLAAIRENPYEDMIFFEYSIGRETQ